MRLSAPSWPRLCAVFFARSRQKVFTSYRAVESMLGGATQFLPSRDLFAQEKSLHAPSSLAGRFWSPVAAAQSMRIHDETELANPWVGKNWGVSSPPFLLGGDWGGLENGAESVQKYVSKKISPSVRTSCSRRRSRCHGTTCFVPLRLVVDRCCNLPRRVCQLRSCPAILCEGGESFELERLRGWC